MYVASYYKPHEPTWAPTITSRMNMNHLIFIGGRLQPPRMGLDEPKGERMWPPCLTSQVWKDVGWQWCSSTSRGTYNATACSRLVPHQQFHFKYNVSAVPGIMDHDCLLLILDMQPSSSRQIQKQIPVHTKADWEAKTGQHVKSCGWESIQIWWGHH